MLLNICINYPALPSTGNYHRFEINPLSLIHIIFDDMGERKFYLNLQEIGMKL